jgi:hypothetical protein
VTTPDSITIRRAHELDDRALTRLAALDSARALSGDVLVAEQDGALRAAVALADGRIIADPFHPTGELVDLLRLRRRRGAAELRLGAPERRLRHALAARR